MIFLKVYGFRDIENLKHPSWQSLRSDLIGDRFFVESRQNAIKLQPQQSDGSEGKISNPHKNLTKHHTCRANFLLARHNTQPLVALNLNCSKIKKFADILFCSSVKCLKVFLLLLFFHRCQILKKNFSKPRKLFLELSKENFQLWNKEANFEIFDHRRI